MAVMSLRFLLLLAIVSVAALHAQSGAGSTKDFWDDKFRSGLPNVRREPSRALVEAVANATPRTALDLGCGEGRNLLYLASKGWKTTGVDLSPVGIAQAKEAASAQQLKAEFVVSDLDTYDLGERRWDLLTSIYMQDWHLKSKTNTFQRMSNALKPGGIVVIEGFGPPNGLQLDAVKRAFDGFEIVQAAVTADDPDWGRGRGNKQILRFIARKPTTTQ